MANQDILNGLRLLLVDDSELIRNIVMRYLNRWGIIAVMVDDAANALRLISESQDVRNAGGPIFDAVLMDIHLPGMDGVTAASEIARIQPGLPVIAMTGDDEAPAIFAAYLRKPVQPAELHERLCEVVGRK